MQHLLKAAAGAARAQVIPPELFREFFISVNDPVTGPDVSL